MLISAILPCYNEGKLLRETHTRLAAVAETLAETAWEFIFVDDGSEDKTAAVLHELTLTDRRVR